MKYGKTLRERSIPAWAHHNIDYDDVKNYIKENTTAGNGTSMSIPGAEDVRGKELEDNLFGILQQQHQRITLFVRSKAGEIERRLDHLQKQTSHLASKSTVNGRIPAKRLERYGRLEADILKVGEELRCLSRFCGAQQTAFRKLLKKHKKWTGSTDLETDFNIQVLGDSASFAKVDFHPLLAEYEETLNTLRALYQDRIGTKTKQSPNLADDRDITTGLRRVLDTNSAVEYDSYLTNLPLGSDGRNAVYWVHPDNVVELQILLLQYGRSFAARKQSPNTGSPALSRTNSISSSTHRRIASLVDPDTGFLVADDIADFVARQSSSTFDEREDSPNSRLQEAAVHTRWSKDEDPQVTARVKKQDVRKVTIKPKYLAPLFDSSPTQSVRKPSISDDQAPDFKQIRSWLSQHGTIQPLASVMSNRSRFVDVSVESTGFVLATLDQNIGMKRVDSLSNPLEDVFSGSTSAEFPFAVLRVRQEGVLNNNLLKILDQSHLVERVRGFSLEWHAVWYCCQPDNVVPPFWIPLMQKDIRKAPNSSSRRHMHKADSSYGSQSTTPQMSTSTGSVADRTGDQTAVEDGSPLRVKIPDQLQTPPLSSFRKKRKSAYQRGGDALPKQRYWNEFDNPSDSEDEGAYVLYIDPNEVSTATKAWRSLRRFLSGQSKAGQEEPLLGHDGAGDVSPTEDNFTSSDEEAYTPKHAARRSYGTLNGTSGQTVRSNHQTQQPDWVPHLVATCFVASILLLAIGYILVATGRRKLASEVDAGIVLAVASSLAFAVGGVGVTYGRRSPSLAAAITAIGVLVLDAAASSILLVWAFG